MSIPTWRLREELRRKANESIRGRAAFEEHVGRKSTKPLTPITLDPHEVLQLLDDTETPDPAEQRPSLAEVVARSRARSDTDPTWRGDYETPGHIKQVLLSMRPGHAAGQGCSCGWHSHSQSFEEHIEEVSS